MLKEGAPDSVKAMCFSSQSDLAWRGLKLGFPHILEFLQIKLDLCCSFLVTLTKNKNETAIEPNSHVIGSTRGWSYT